MITTIRVPAHWSTADQADVDRWLVGAIIEAAELPYNAVVDVRGVKNPLLYGATWTHPRRSRLVRTAGQLVAVAWKIA